MNNIYLSIIVPTHNSQNTINHLLLSIINSQFNNFPQIELIVVDDGSTDKTISVLNQALNQIKFKYKIYRMTKNAGPAKARNLGVEKAHGKYVLFLDSDVRLKPNSLQRAFNISRQAKIKAFTGIWHYQQMTQNFFPQFKALRDWSYWFIEREKYARYYLFSTRIAGIEKKLFNKIGGFDQSYPEPTVEDIELTYRIEKQAKIKFCSDIVVNHEFENFLPIALKYYKRSRDWVGLYMQRLRFDPVATSQSEAFKSLIASLIPFFSVLAIFEIFFIYPALLLLLIYSYLEYQFWWFLLKKKGVAFLLKSIPTSIALYFIINLGAFNGLLLLIRNGARSKLKSSSPASPGKDRSSRRQQKKKLK